jgi:hypothetical protein
MLSLGVGRGLEDLEMWPGSHFFTAVELAAADLLLRLSGDDAAEASTSSPRWVSPCREDLGVDEEEEEERVVWETDVPPELDRRARKRYRLLSDLYTATSAAAATATKKRKTCAGGDSESSSASLEATRY